MTCLDLSNWQYPVEGTALKRAGVTEIIIGAQIPPQSRQIVDSCLAAGIACRSDYAFLWDVETATIRTQKAIDFAFAYKLPLVWLDVEEGNSQPSTVSGRVASLRACRKQVEDAGLKCGIYTLRPYWMNEMGNSKEFSDLPLWYANWGANDATLPPITTVNFGGWTSVAVHQYTSQYPINGGLDANYILDESIFGDDAMTPAERIEFDELKANFERVWREGYIVGPPDDDGSDVGYNLLATLRRHSDAINDHIESPHGSGSTNGSVTGTFTGKITGGQ